MASVSYNQMLEVVLAEYPNQKWHERVSKWPPANVIAVYHSIMERREREKEKADKLLEKVDAIAHNEYYGHQIDMFEYAAKEGIDIYGKGERK